MTAKKGKTKQRFSREEVEKLLQMQRSACAESIQGDNLSEYNARRKINETKLVEI